MSGTDSCQAKIYRGGLGDLGEVGHVQGHSFWAGGQGHYPVPIAPGGELSPAGAVNTVGVLGTARSNIIPRLGGDLSEFDSLFGAMEQRHCAHLSSFVTTDKLALS